MSVWSDDAERQIRDMDINSDERKVYLKAKDYGGRYLGPINLDEKYKEFQKRYFNGRVPDLSVSFICVFQPLPYDISGITILQGDERFQDEKKGIRINKCLEKFCSETQVALLHEMIHATGITGHGLKFKFEIVRLLLIGAYGNLIIDGGFNDDEFNGIL
jgi:hypothetical protein